MKNDPLEALKKAKQFINNGIEFGYITMPDKDTPDTAKETPEIIEQAIPQQELIMEFVEAYGAYKNYINSERYKTDNSTIRTATENELCARIHLAWQKLKEGMDNG